MHNDIIYNIAQIETRIQKACLQSGRARNDVQLLLATKTVPPQSIALALQQGYTLIAENKVQELKEKYEALKDIPHTRQFIGHLQTNKIKDLLKYGVSCIQSLDRWELAEKLHQRLTAENRKIAVLIQVNTSDENSKFGIHPNQAAALIQQIAELDTIQIKGLMTIGLFSTDTGKVRKCFQRLRAVQQEIRTLDIPGVCMDELSMGMSGDLEIAIAEGATIIRVGTAIFGPRNTPDNYYWNEQTTSQ